MEKGNTKEKLSKIFTIVFKLLYYLVISFVCLIAAFLIFYIVSSQINADNPDYKPRVSIYTIVSPSMTPNINVYDVVVNIRPEHPSEIEIGDIITYRSTAATSEGMTITHRVIAKEQLPDGTYEFMTQGDNNSEPDSVYVTFDNIIGKEIVTIPKVGHLQFLIANQKGWLFLLLIPIGIYLLREVFKLVDLMGLRKKVNKVIINTEEPKDNEPIDYEKQATLKARIKEDMLKNESRKDSYIRSTQEPEGFLEKYSETVVKVKENKYIKDHSASKELVVEKTTDSPVIAPTKVDTDKIIPKEVDKLEIELPKIKQKPEVVNDEYEVLDTDDLTIKIKEYDTNIQKIDKMIKDIDNIQQATSTQGELVEVDDFLQGSKIKVIKIEDTKNKKKAKSSLPKEDKEIKLDESDVVINLGGIIPEINTRLKIEHPVGEDIKKLRKEEIAQESKPSKPKERLKLNPNNIKKINRKPKKAPEKPTSSKKNSTKLNLNPKDIKKINRPGKKKVESPKKSTKKEHFIRIEKRK